MKICWRKSHSSASCFKAAGILALLWSHGGRSALRQRLQPAAVKNISLQLRQNSFGNSGEKNRQALMLNGLIDTPEQIFLNGEVGTQGAGYLTLTMRNKLHVSASSFLTFIQQLQLCLCFKFISGSKFYIKFIILHFKVHSVTLLNYTCCLFIVIFNVLETSFCIIYTFLYQLIFFLMLVRSCTEA